MSAAPPFDLARILALPIDTRLMVVHAIWDSIGEKRESNGGAATTIDLSPIFALPIGERIEVAFAVWNSIADEGGPPGELSDEVKAMLDQRLKNFRENPDSGIPWEEVRDAALARGRR